MAVRIERLTPAADLDVLEPLWLALHHHHQAVSDFDGFVADDATSWHRRRAPYAALLSNENAVVLLARDNRGPGGYALARLITKPNDTFDTRSTYAELESLSVRGDARAAGIGTLLLGRLDALLAEQGIVDMVVSVLTDNVEALRLYQRRGLTPVQPTSGASPLLRLLAKVQRALKPSRVPGPRTFSFHERQTPAGGLRARPGFRSESSSSQSGSG